MEYRTLADESVPAVGLGTWQMDTDTAREAVETGLELGYRHVDTAQMYENETGVGAGIAAADVEREDVFLTTKVNPTHRSISDIVGSVEGSLDRLGVDHVDLLLIHWPHPLANLETVINGLERAREAGYTKHIGVSNFGRDRLERAQELADAPIVTDQVLFHRWWTQPELREYCQSTETVLTGYSPLANGALVDDQALQAIGSRYDKSAAQVAIRWAIHHDTVMTIPMSTTRAHLKDNIDIFDFSLTEAEHDRITEPSYLKTGIAMLRGQLGI